MSQVLQSIRSAAPRAFATDSIQRGGNKPRRVRSEHRLCL